jgi:hypothetical protein
VRASRNFASINLSVGWQRAPEPPQPNRGQRFARDLDNFTRKSFDLELSCARIRVAKFLPTKSPRFESFAPSLQSGSVSERNLFGFAVSNF